MKMKSVRLYVCKTSFTPVVKSLFEVQLACLEKLFGYDFWTLGERKKICIGHLKMKEDI